MSERRAAALETHLLQEYDLSLNVSKASMVLKSYQQHWRQWAQQTVAPWFNL